VLVRMRLHEVVAAARPGAVLADRSAVLGGRPTADNLLFIVHPNGGDLLLPGDVLVRSRPGAPALPSDMPVGGLALSSPARAALETMVPSRSRGGKTSRTLSRVELETWLDHQVSRHGEAWAVKLRTQITEIAPALGLEAEAAKLDVLLGALLGTRTVKAATPALQARMRGAGFDASRVAQFDQLLAYLSSTAPPVPIPADGGPREHVLPFVEAYFSNFIEGTEFTFEEAAAIVYEGSEPSGRPEDAHDVLGTYEIASSDDMKRTPGSADDLIAIAERRHQVIMAARLDKRPGAFKEQENRAGGTTFVAPRLVAGTLKAGFERYAQLDDPFARAAFMMFLISEVHPFDDGNGRVARLMTNAELVSAGQARIVIPNVYRNNYLMALKGLTHNGNAPSYVAMLSFAQRYTAQLDYSTLASAQRDLDRTNAFHDPTEADAVGIRLVLPNSVLEDGLSSRT
jgi:hypothetical protein